MQGAQAVGLACQFGAGEVDDRHLVIQQDLHRGPVGRIGQFDKPFKFAQVGVIRVAHGGEECGCRLVGQRLGFGAAFTAQRLARSGLDPAALQDRLNGLGGDNFHRGHQLQRLAGTAAVKFSQPGKIGLADDLFLIGDAHRFGKTREVTRGVGFKAHGRGLLGGDCVAAGKGDNIAHDAVQLKIFRRVGARDAHRRQLHRILVGDDAAHHHRNM